MSQFGAPSPDMTLEHPEMAPDTVGGASFDRYANALSARHVYWGSALFAVSNLAVWPTDMLFIQSGSAFAAAWTPMRLGFVGVAMATFLALGTSRWMRRHAVWVLLGGLIGGLLVAGLTVVRAWTPFDRHSLAWFHTGYLTPLFTLTLIIPLWKRVLLTLALPAMAGVVFLAVNPEIFRRHYLGIPLIVWVFVCVVSVAVGEVLFRLLRVNFNQRRALAEETERLQDKREGLEATIEWLKGLNEMLSSEIQSKTKGLRVLVERLHRERDEERKRISYELDDELARQLLDLRVEVAQARERARNDGELTEMLAGLDGHLAQALETVHSLIDELSPSWVPGQGLVGALGALVDSIRLRFSQTIRLSILPEAFELPGEQAQSVYRVTHEALRNALRHAQATDVNITVTYTPGRLEVRVADNGRGLPPEEWRPRGLGIPDMRERAAAMGGRITFDSQPGQGTRLTLELPVIAHLPAR